MEFSARQLCDLLQGKLEGDPDVRVNSLSKIEEGTPGSLSFLANPKYAEFIYNTGASIVLVAKDFVLEKPISPTLIRLDDVYMSFTKLLEMYHQKMSEKNGIEEPCYIDPSVEVPEDIYIGAFAYIGKNVKLAKGIKIHPHVYLGDNVELGEGTVLHDGVKIYHSCKLGTNCTLHAGVVIGADGFGFAPQSENLYHKVPQIGNVIIEDHVEIGANTAIDRATLGSTFIRKGVKLDNLIQIAHNVDIGENTVIAAQTGIAGSTKIGRDCMIGGQVGIVGHITIADRVKIAAQSGIGASITREGDIVQGSPAIGIGDFKRAYVVFKKLPEVEKRIENIEKLNLGKSEA